ncbi:response regulator [Rhodoferax sp.]|uniref:response regulator n=1 Tax=Rhodoferax sp. TaxID=50421 RepID=UPI00261C72C8|nr:response regulator [Rhodoferax sp.]MDD2808768.1 response regulator [Rhodoferax sp.]MDD4944592.1 response regulator [Rhodoferax sp.]
MSQTMMVVDDSMVFRHRITRLASDGRLKNIKVVAQAGDGLQALEQAKIHQPNLVTMDLTMPLMDGSACLEALQIILPQARVLVVSALSDRATALKALTKGAHGFLMKPFSEEQLLDALQELMA